MTDKGHEGFYIVGVISDTHGVLRPEAVAALQGCDLIVHAGDVGRPEVLDDLREIGPVYAVRGNSDRGAWADVLPETEVIQVGEISLYILHDVSQLDLDPVAANFTAVIFGHSHRPAVGEKDGVMYLNPGSAGPQRFTLPVTLARLHIREGHIHPEVVELA